LVAAVRPRCETQKGYSPRWRPTSPPPFRNDGGDGGHLPWLARRNMSTLTRRRSGRAAHALSSRRGARRSAGSRGARVAPSSSAGARYLPRRDRLHRVPHCDSDLACDDACLFLFFCESVHSPQLAVPVGQKQVIKLTCLPNIAVTKFVLRCRRHPQGVPCPTTTTTSTTVTTTMPCPTTTTLGAPSCQGSGGSCFRVCLGGQTCSADGSGQCVCSGPLQCGVNGVCGGSCPPGQGCLPAAVPGGCNPTGTCDCR